MAERYTVQYSGHNFSIYEEGSPFSITTAKDQKTADFIARALNAYAALEQVQSIGEANKKVKK